MDHLNSNRRTLLTRALFRTSIMATTDIPPLGLGLIALVMCVNGIFSIAMNLNMGPALFVSIVRSCLQLAAFGYMLVPIFNAQHWAPVILFAMFMIVLGAREAFVRPQYTYKDIFWHLCATLTFSCFFLTMFGTALCIMVVPFWNPQYFIPILALLIGNSVSAITIGLDTCLSHFKEGREQIEALLIRGATKWEASRGVVSESIRSALSPFLNQISIICLAFLPGLMSGQIMGGASPDVASHYQILLVVLIITSSIIGVWISVVLAVYTVFDKHDRLRVERINRRSEPYQDLLLAVWQSVNLLLPSAPFKRMSKLIALDEK